MMKQNSFETVLFQFRLRFISVLCKLRGQYKWPRVISKGNGVPIVKIFKNALGTALRTTFRPKMKQDFRILHIQYQHFSGWYPPDLRINTPWCLDPNSPIPHWLASVSIVPVSRNDLCKRRHSESVLTVISSVSEKMSTGGDDCCQNGACQKSVFVQVPVDEWTTTVVWALPRVVTGATDVDRGLQLNQMRGLCICRICQFNVTAFVFLYR